MRTLITVSGNLTNQPVARWTKDGVQVVDFGLACNSRRQDRTTGLWEDGEPSFFTVTCWRRLAENVMASLHKGDPVLVHARFSTREYALADGTPKTELKLEAQSVGPDLGRSTALVRRTKGTGADTAGGSDAAAEPEGGLSSPRPATDEHEDGYHPTSGGALDARPLVPVPAAEG